MEFEKYEEQKLDLFILLDDFLKEAKRMWLLALVLIVLGAAGLAGYRYLHYRPSYVATASFTVQVSNPLYGGVSGYNSKTAEQLAKTYPYIISNSVLQNNVKEELGISAIPSISVSATAGSSIITLKVTDSDPQRAYDVLNAVMKYYPELAQFVVGSTEMNLLDESGVPTQPVNSFDLKSSLIKGGMIGGLLWCALALLMALTNNTVHNEDELKQVLNLPCLGQMPNVKVRKDVCPLIFKGKKIPAFTEGIRLLCLRVEKAMGEDQKKVLLISSAISGEGKTTISVNLSIALAKKGKRVLLIDCDLRNPSVAKALQISDNSTNSFIEYLQGSADVRDILIPTEFNNLTIINGGSGKESSAAELLSQEQTAQLIQAARNLFDYVILDTPPCSLLEDAAEIANMADCGLMVIRQDLATRDQIWDGVQRLTDEKLPLIGCAFNGVRKSLSAGYGYGYGYGYGHGYGNKSE